MMPSDNLKRFILFPQRIQKEIDLKGIFLGISR